MVRKGLSSLVAVLATCCPVLCAVAGPVDEEDPVPVSEAPQAPHEPCTSHPCFCIGSFVRIGGAMPDWRVAQPAACERVMELVPEGALPARGVSGVQPAARAPELSGLPLLI